MAQLAQDLLAELISLPSVNPRLASGADRTGETRVTEWLGRFCSSHQWPWALQQVEPGRCNFLALVAGRLPQTILWEAHQDTVGVEGMTVPPFAATRREGRVYGRGACDVKGSMACLLSALNEASSSPGDRPSLLFAATVNEECGFTGARALAGLWRDVSGGESPSNGSFEARGGLSLEEARARKPAAAVVAEPTGLAVVVAHRGVIRWQCTAHGRAAHSSRPEQGANAVYALAEAVRVVERRHAELAANGADPWCGPATATVTTFHGGLGPNTIPDRAVIDVDRRLAPHEDPAEAYRELVERIAAEADAHGCRFEHAAAWMQSRGMAAEGNLAWAERVAAVAGGMGLGGAICGAPYGTNAASIAAAGIPVVVCGPGSIEQAHTADEWIAEEQLAAGERFFKRLARETF
jgi:acetylornithine deacetylase